MDADLIPTLQKMHTLVPSVYDREEFIALVQKCVTTLEKRVAAAEQKVDDWSVQSPVSCKCAECKPVRIPYLITPYINILICGILTLSKVIKFLKSATEKDYRYKAPQAKRDHIESSLIGHYNNRNVISQVLKFTTDKRSTPQVLVITKIAKEADVEKKKAKTDETTIATLNSMLNGPSGGQERATKRQKVGYKD